MRRELVAFHQNAIHFAAALILVCGILGCGNEARQQSEHVVDGDRSVSRSVHSDPPEPWISKATVNWPQIVLTNEARFAGHTPLQGASSFLVSSRNGRVFAATARHLIGENGGVKPDLFLNDFDSALREWHMFPRTVPTTFIGIEGLGVSGLDLPNCDWLILKVKQDEKKLPAKPLHVRSESVTIGEHLYLIGCPYVEQDCVQNVYRATVTARRSDRFRYDLDPPVELRGFSGAPIIDEKGYLVGVMTVWFNPKVQGETYLEGGGEDASVIYPLIEKE